MALLAGLRREAERHGAALVGGDLAAAPGPFGVAVTALGEFLGPGRPPGRDRLRAGQAVILTGPVGGSLLGRHLRIEPRFRAGQALFAAGARALMDVSDGLALDLSRLARASGLGIQLEAVPIHRDARRRASASGRTALDHALTDGEDHELIAGLPPSKAERLLRGGLPDCPGALRIGTVIARPGLWLRFPGERPRRWSGPGGYVHGEEPPR